MFFFCLFFFSKSVSTARMFSVCRLSFVWCPPQSCTSERPFNYAGLEVLRSPLIFPEFQEAASWNRLYCGLSGQTAFPKPHTGFNFTAPVTLPACLFSKVNFVSNVSSKIPEENKRHKFESSSTNIELWNECREQLILTSLINYCKYEHILRH